MGTITGLTADRMLEIEAASIVDGDVVGDDLFLTRHDGTPINVGNVRGIPGPKGDIGPSAAPPLVTSLPALPTDGQEVFFVASAAQGVIWHLRYRAASPNAQKWEFVGGRPLRKEENTPQTTSTATTWLDLGTVGPSITVPLTGAYDVSWSTVVNIGTAGAQTTYAGPAVAAGTPAFSSKTALNNVNQYQTTFQKRPIVWTANQECRLRYRIQIAVLTAFDERWIEILPQWVG